MCDEVIHAYLINILKTFDEFMANLNSYHKYCWKGVRSPKNAHSAFDESN